MGKPAKRHLPGTCLNAWRESLLTSVSSVKEMVHRRARAKVLPVPMAAGDLSGPEVPRELFGSSPP
jgi:hypothetical protein